MFGRTCDQLGPLEVVWADVSQAKRTALDGVARRSCRLGKYSSCCLFDDSRWSVNAFDGKLIAEGHWVETRPRLMAYWVSSAVVRSFSLSITLYLCRSTVRDEMCRISPIWAIL